MFLFWIVFIVFISLSLLLPAIILMQEPKRGGLGDALGGANEAFSGPRGAAGGLHKLTIYLGTMWGLSALALAVLPRL